MNQLQVHCPGRIVCLNWGLQTVSFDVASKPALREGEAAGASWQERGAGGGGGGTSSIQKPSNEGCPRAAVPSLLGTRDLFCGRQFFHEWGMGEGSLGTIQAHEMIIIPAPPQSISH